MIAAARERTASLKEAARMDKVMVELCEYEDEVLFPMAAAQVQIDLDDGVKVNYNKLDKALKRVAGLSA